MPKTLFEEEETIKVYPALAAAMLKSQCAAQAAQIGADFAMLSPVLPTRSHPDADPLGWQRFADWVEGARLPVFALGGMRPEMEGVAWSHGAQGVAGIRGMWPEAEATP